MREVEVCGVPAAAAAAGERGGGAAAAMGERQALAAPAAVPAAATGTASWAATAAAAGAPAVCGPTQLQPQRGAVGPAAAAHWRASCGAIVSRHHQQEAHLGCMEQQLVAFSPGGAAGGGASCRTVTAVDLAARLWAGRQEPRRASHRQFSLWSVWAGGCPASSMAPRTRVQPRVQLPAPHCEERHSLGLHLQEP